MIRLLLALLALWLVAVTPAYADTRYIPAKSVIVTYYYPTGNPMYNGRYPFIGAAGCSWDMPLDSVVLFPDGRIVVCMDRGMLGSSGHVDIFAATPAMGKEIALAYPGRVTVSLFIPEGN